MSSFELNNLSKSFKDKKVIDNSGFKVEYGNVLGVLGLNGSGKTTLFNCLAGIESSDDKRILLSDRGKFSYMSRQNFFEHSDKVKDAIMFFEMFFNDFDAEFVKSELIQNRIDLKSKLRELSLGQRCLVDFLLCVGRRTKLYMLDEPFSNIDVLVREYMKRTIISQIDDDKLFFISSHDITEFENIFSKIVILKKGKFSDVFDVESIRESGMSINDFYKRYVEG